MKKFYLLLFIPIVLTACWQQNKNSEINKIDENKQIIETWTKEQISNLTWQTQQIDKQNQEIPNWSIENIQKAVEKIKDLKECDDLFKKKEDILACKRSYILINPNKFDVSVCKNIQDEQEQKSCTLFFEQRKKVWTWANQSWK